MKPDKNTGSMRSVGRVPALPVRAAVHTDAAVVPADGQSVVYLHNLVFGSRVHVDGPDPEAFEIGCDSVALAFVYPGRYLITVQAPDGGCTQLCVHATRAPGADDRLSWPSAC